MGKKSGGSSSTSSVVTPSWLEPFTRKQASVGTGALTKLDDLLSGAGAEDLVAGFSPTQREGFDLALSRARGGGGFLPTAQDTILKTAQGVDPSSYVDPTAYGALSDTAAGKFLYGGEAFQAAVDAASRAGQARVLSTFGRSGRGDSGLARTAIARNTTDAFASQYGEERAKQLAAAGVLADLGGTERGRQISAAGALPGIATADASILERIGGIEQGQAQRELTAPLSAQESLLAAIGGGVPLQSLLSSYQTTSGGADSTYSDLAAAGLLGLGAANEFGWF